MTQSWQWQWTKTENHHEFMRGSEIWTWTFILCFHRRNHHLYSVTNWWWSERSSSVSDTIQILGSDRPSWFIQVLTHWGRVTHICVGKPIIIGSDNGLSPDRRQAIIWTRAGIFIIGPLGTNFSEILTGIQTFSFKKMHLKMSSVKWRPFCLGLNVLKRSVTYINAFCSISPFFKPHD